MAYAAVLFDLFDTLVDFDRERLPAIEINGRSVRTTAGHLLEILRRLAPEITIGACYDALIASWQEAERLRALDHREVSAPQRFQDLLRRLTLDPCACPPGFVDALLETHRRELAKAAHFPEHHGPLLAKLVEHHALAVVSNFDYTPTAVGLLERAGVAELFSAIVVSDAVGWRKPKAAIFNEALRRLGVRASDALFVGDRVEIDVLGAQGVGMPAAWLNKEGTPLPPGIAPPEYEIRDLAELTDILKV